MKRTLTCTFALAALVVAAAAQEAGDLTVDNVLKQMSAKVSTVQDLRVSAKVTRYDAVSVDLLKLRMEFYYKDPHSYRADTYRRRKKNGPEVHTSQLIVGKDYILRVWPENRNGKRESVAPEEMKRRRNDRSNPLPFLSQKPDEMKKDFDVKFAGPVKNDRAKLIILPKKGIKGFRYQRVELVVNTKTWLPASIRTMVGTDDEDDWSLYEFTKFKVNAGVKDSDLQPPPGTKITEKKPKKQKPTKKTTKP